MIFRKLVYSHLLFYFHGYEATMSVFTAVRGEGKGELLTRFSIVEPIF